LSSRFSLTWRLAIQALEPLDVRHYIEGPNPDDKGRPFHMWIFGPVFRETKQVYVKISEPNDEAKPTVIWSFHWPEHPIRKPPLGTSSELKLPLPTEMPDGSHEGGTKEDGER
jgi:hypothetical protein